MEEKLRLKFNQKKYLEELSELSGRQVQLAELGSIEQAAAIREAGKAFVSQSVTTSEILFSERSSQRIKGFVKRLSEANSSPVYVWSPRTIDCGAFQLPSLCIINLDFSFNINEEGILVFLTADLLDRLLFDFFSLPTGEQRLKIETQGENWGRIMP